MDAHELQRRIILATLVRDVPKGFWEDARNRARQTYLDIFHEVAAYPNMLADQRSEKLHYDRFFRMEHLISMLAEEYGFAWSPNVLQENGHHYVYAARGTVGLTQTYVPAIGDMPKPAKFRERLAAMNNIAARPRLALGDETQEIFSARTFYGLLAHNPVGKRFTESEQRLGMIQFCVPAPGCTKWEAQYAIEEIVSAYDAVAPAQKPDRSLPWKKRDADKKGGQK